MKKKIVLLLTVVLPIITGGLIYILFAIDRLLIFQFIKTIGLWNVVENLRFYFLEFYYPDWVLYQFPDALWVFATTSYMLIVWKGQLIKKNSIWVFSGLLLAIPAEILQLTLIVPGTFDTLDIYSYITAFFLSLGLFQLPTVKAMIL